MIVGGPTKDCMLKCSDQESATHSGQPNRAIIDELYRTLVLLGAGSDLLGTVGSWGDSLPDQHVLAGLRAWNAGTLTEIKARIEHYEMSSHHQGESPDAVPQTILAAQ